MKHSQDKHRAPDRVACPRWLLAAMMAGGLFGRAGGVARAARFTDPFTTGLTAPRRRPFIWDGFYSRPYLERVWTAAGGVLTYRAERSVAGPAFVRLAPIGVRIDDDAAWSLEAAFRHVAGAAPRPEYETVAYVTWFARRPGHMRILAVMYDCAHKALIVFNAGKRETVASVDLSGPFHPVRMTAAAGSFCVYVDGRLRAGPTPIRSMVYSQAPAFYLGPIANTRPHTLCFQFDYFAFTDAGAFAPHDPSWTPQSDTAPVAEGLKQMQDLVANAPHSGIKLLKREKGSALWDQAIPAHWRELRAIIATEPRQRRVACYAYPGEPAPSLQNFYPAYSAFQYDARRTVALSLLTRGIDDTPEGFIDYKLWYRISTDGGRTYDQERPLLQSGAEFSPTHPNRYVWIGKNGFCYASVPAMLRLSNGEVLMPFYFAPLDEHGRYYNPLNAHTFTYAAAMIGRWNEAGDDLVWDASEAIRLGPDQSSRGANECAAIELSQPGHILMVVRGSNAPNPRGAIPPVKWKTLSTDYGRTWSACTAFTYADGDRFMSPSSCSSFFRSSRTGKVYWIGNISRVLPAGNHPRYPLVIAELDEDKLGLRKDTLTIIDDREASDPLEVQFSNFNFVEDPATGHLILSMSRLMPPAYRRLPHSGRYTYAIEVK